MLYEIWRKWPFLFKFRFILGLILVIIISLFLYLKIVPFGRISYSRDYTSAWKFGKGFINNFTPLERVDLNSEDGALLIGDPIYFSLFTPRTFDKAKITVIYKDNLSIETPIIEAGVLADNIVWRYDLRPLDNKALDYLMLRWNLIEENGTIFLQKNNSYANLADFKKDFIKNELKDCSLNREDCLALYNYDLAYDYRITNYQPARPIVIDTPLRGAHQFYVYLNNELLNLEFNFTDLNQSKKTAPIQVIISGSDKIIASEIISDDSKNTASGKTEEKKLTINKTNLPTGVYRVEIKVSDDIVIKKIASSLDRLVFINKVWPVSGGKPLKLYTNSDYLQIKTLNPTSLQTVYFGGQKFNLDETYKQFYFKINSEVTAKEVNLSKDDLILENSGVFAFSEKSLFNPDLKKVDRFFSVHDDNQYIIASYKKPTENEGFKTATTELNLKGAYRENGKYSFMISVPGLKAEDDIKYNLEIYKIKIELNGRTLWQKIWD